MMDEKAPPTYESIFPHHPQIPMQSYPKNVFSQTASSNVPLPHIGNVTRPQQEPMSRDPVRYPDNFGQRRSQEVEAVPDQFQAFEDQAIRRAFIRKVYSIISVQLFVTGAIISVFIFVNPVKR